MRVAKVFINKFSSGKMRGFANVRFSLTDGGDGCVTISGFKVFEGQDGLWVAAPSRKDDKSGEWKPLVDFYMKDADAEAFKKHIDEEVIRAYLNKDDSQPAQSANSQASSGGGIAEEDIPF